MKKAFLFIFSAIALLNLVSCYEDEGNYDYVDLQRFIVDTTGVNMSITVTQFDQLSVPSRLVYDGNKGDLDYYWVAYKNETYGDNPCENYPGPRHYYFNFGMDRKDRHTWSPQVMNPNYVTKKTNDKYTYYANKGSQAGGVFKKLADAAKFGAPPVRPFAVDVLEPGRHGFGCLLCDAIHVPGHSPGHLCYHFPRQSALFSGDTLFYHMLATTGFAAYQSAELLARSVAEKLRPLPPATAVYPGHGKRTTLAEELAFGTFGKN